jgi:histone acetyltransferase 1
MDRNGRVEFEGNQTRSIADSQRQFDRLLEMLLLKQLDRKDPAKLRSYRLHVS